MMRVVVMLVDYRPSYWLFQASVRTGLGASGSLVQAGSRRCVTAHLRQAARPVRHFRVTGPQAALAAPLQPTPAQKEL